MYTRKFRLHNMPYAQVHVTIDYDEEMDHVAITLCSHSTDVLQLVLNRDSSPTVAELYCVAYDSDIYTRTTAKHIQAFTEEFCEDRLYHTIKRAAQSTENIMCNNWHFVTTCVFDTALSMCVKYLNNSFAIGNVEEYRGKY